MKILRCIHSLNPAIGGPIESVRQSSAVLAEWGHQVEIACFDSPDDEWIRAIPEKVHAFGRGRGGYSYTPRYTRWLRDHHTEFDAVLIHGVWLYNSFGAWRALHDTATPYFIFPHGMLDPWFKRTYPIKHLKKSLYWRWAERRVLRDAAAVLFTSEEERRLARQSFGGYACREVVVSYGTAAPRVDLAAAREEFYSRFPELRSKRILLFLSRLHEKKGCDILIDAFAAVASTTSKATELHLVLAGPAADAGYAEELQRRASERAGANVTFAGMMSGNAKWGAFAAADAFILPSHQENFGIAVVEALACRKPVLISNKVNIWREIVDAGAGFADDDDLAGTQRLIERWLELSDTEIAKMCAAAGSCFDAHFEIHRATKDLLEVIQQRIRGNGAAEE